MNIFILDISFNQKLATIPPSAFYSAGHKHLAKDLVRFCFFKVGLLNKAHISQSCNKCSVVNLSHFIKKAFVLFT